MIETTHGNLLETNVDALVNPVNCVGVMGKGLALQFKKTYPDNDTAYRAACERGDVVPGRMFVHPLPDSNRRRWIINFPTKRHWRSKSRLDDIRSGLASLSREITERDIESIAIPALGCGLGGLPWTDVSRLIHEAMAPIVDVRVLLFEPREAFTAEGPILNRPRRPRPLTAARALFVQLMARYGILGYECTQLVAQKLAYFLQEAGRPLQLNYDAAHYGPYADNLNKVLEALEGRYIRGYTGDRGPNVAITLEPDAANETASFLEESGDAHAAEHLARVTRLIEGFEEPHGLELLASIHWVATKPSPPTTDIDEIHQRLASWNARKRELSKPHHVQVAWSRLVDEGWFPTTLTTPTQPSEE